MLSLAILTACLAVPLGISLVSDPNALGNNLRATLQEELSDYPGVRIGDLATNLRRELPLIEVELFGPQSLDTEIARRVSDAIKTYLDEPCDVRIIMLQEWRSKPE